MRSYLAIAAGLLIGTAAASAQAQADYGFYQGPWRTIASKTVNPGIDRDTVRVSDRYRFREIRLCVSRAPVRMRDLDVVYGNGRRDDLKVRKRIRAGTCSGPLDLKGGRAREIDRILISYERANEHRGRPRVDIQAR